MTDIPLLTIAISSRNRAAKLDSQIRWAADGIDGRWDQCQLLVADGASTDSTPDVCRKWKAELGENFTCVRQPENLGLVAGICFSIEQAAGEYVWTVGDDDFMQTDGVTTVLNALQEERELGLLHLNYRVVDGINGALLRESFYPWKEDLRAAPGQGLIERCLLHDEGGLQFMTANVVRRELAMEAVRLWPDGINNLAMPIYIYSYAGKNASARVVSRPTLGDAYNLSAWYDRSTCVYYKDVPEVLLRLKQVGFDRQVMNRLVLKRLRFKVNTGKALVKFFLKFPGDFTRSIPYYVRALRGGV
jgi:glycosyltransferase involved in cell wall biosynthesis